MNVFITGGAGFIGSNAAAYYLTRGHTVTIFDNLSRKGASKNLEWLKTLGGKLFVTIGDIRNGKDLDGVRTSIASADLLLHLAAQVAVTTSVTNPREDFDINAHGTFNVLEAARASKTKAKFIYSSTNKVYGGMEDVEVVKEATRYAYKNLPFGVGEDRRLDFHSPYGCSKGAADQYIHDYGRIYGLDTVVMRQSCIYGPRQFGVEDQGWVAWFIIAQTIGIPLSIYGDGKQVRDLLFVDDLIGAFDKAYQAGEKTRGSVYNIGGGPDNVMSVWSEFGPMLKGLFGRRIAPSFHPWRQGDQKVFISDIRKAQNDFGWAPTIGVKNGIARLYQWVTSNAALFA